MLDLPYSDTNVPVMQSKQDIQKFLEKMDLRNVFWGTEYHDNAQAHILLAEFEDGTGFRVALPATITGSGDEVEKQMLRIFYHYIKAISVMYEMEIMSKAEMMLGMLKVGETNFGSVVDSDQMIDVMHKASAQCIHECQENKICDNCGKNIEGTEPIYFLNTVYIDEVLEYFYCSKTCLLEGSD